MLKMVFIVGVLFAAAAGIALLIVDRRSAHRRRTGRSRREGDYAERQANWRTYLQVNQHRKVRRITDERAPED